MYNVPYSLQMQLVKQKAQELSRKYQCDAAPVWLLALYMMRTLKASELLQMAVHYGGLRHTLLEKWGMTEDGPGSYGVRCKARASTGEMVERAPSQPVLDRAAQMAIDGGCDVVTPVHLALALLSDPAILEILHAAGTNQSSLDRLKAELHAQALLSPALVEPESSEPPAANAHGEGRGEQSGARELSEPPARPGGTAGGGEKLPPWRPKSVPADSALRKYAVDLTELAAAGKLDPVIGREREIDLTIEILGKRKKKNPILVGPPGIGKTSIVEGVAMRIVKGEVPSRLLDQRVFSVTMSALLEGTDHRGEFEARLKAVLNEAIQNGYRLFFDETHTVLGAGLTRGSNLDASNILKPALAGTELSAIGATTLDEYKKIFEKDGALSRRFDKVPVAPPSVEESIAILMRLKHLYEDHHNVDYDLDTIRAAVELTHRYVRKRNLPDKAIDAMDIAGSSVASRLAGSSDRATRPKVTIDDIAEIVTRWTGIDVRSRLEESERARLLHLEESIGERVVSQRPAIKAVSAAVRRARAGLKRSEKLIGAYLFAGPTGVGKTETAKQLARALGLDFVRFDMALYMEKSAVSRLIGADPGLVRSDEGGLLTNAIDEHPYCVLLLDEIEKAHPDIWNILLSVMDYGQLEDAQGRVVDFRNVLLILTTNAGVFEMRRSPIGYTGKAAKAGANGSVPPSVQEALNRMFSPEFRNRLDETIMFADLAPDEIVQIVDIHLDYVIRPMLACKQISIELTPPARRLLARLGFDEEMGARPLERVFNTQLLNPLADEILAGKLKEGAALTIGVDAGETELVFPWTEAQLESDV